MEDWRSRDLLNRVHEVCRLYWRGRGERDVQIEERESEGFGYLKVSYTRGPWTRHELIGVCDGPPDDALAGFRRLVTDSGAAEATLVHLGEPVGKAMAAEAARHGLWLRTLDSYQATLWTHGGYRARQTARLAADVEYPLVLHLDKRWAPLGDRSPADRTAVPQILDWLAADGPAFVLVLGDSGTGKTFLLHVLANELAERAELVPVLVTMRDLEKGRTLDELLAQHMSHAGEDPFHVAGFRYLLREGRVALLFDGFDELALRTSYERVEQHFATLREAAAGAAKVVVTSRHQYFATDGAVHKAMGDEVSRMPGSRLIRLFPLAENQRHRLVVAAFDDDEAAADEFLEALRGVPNLLDLTTNPRMLTFMIRWYREGILTAAALADSATSEEMTAGALYLLLLTTWLEHEVARQTAAGGLPPLSVTQRMAALREAAVRMWRTGQRSIPLDELGEVADKISDLARLEMRRGEAVHAVGSSTALVRTADDEFGFIHQSVMEWFVAAAASHALAADGHGGLGAVLGNHAMTAPMADFLCDLAGAELVLDWARAVVGRANAPGPAAKSNATLVLQRRGAQAATVNYVNEDLRGRDLTGQDLTGADLTGADLTGAVLPTAMRGALLSGAQLVGARLDRADLTDADLPAADLRRARLDGAVLVRARLPEADLRRARLAGADLTGALLSGTRLDRAVLTGATADPAALARTTTFGAALPDTPLMSHVVGQSLMTAATLLHDPDLLATSHLDGTIRVSDLAAGRVIWVTGDLTDPVTALAADPQGRWLAAAAGGRIELLNPTTGERFGWLSGLPAVTALAVSPDGRWLASAGTDRTVRLWSVDTGEVVWSARCGGAVTALAFDPTGCWVAGAEAQQLRMWETASAREHHVRSPCALTGGGLAVGHDGRWVWAGGVAGTVTWAVNAGIHLAKLPGPPTVVTVDPAGGWAAAVDSDATTIQLYSRITDTLLRGLEPTGRRWTFAWIQALRSSRSGDVLVALDRYGGGQAWEPDTGRPVGSLIQQARGIRSVSAGPDGSWLVAVGDGAAARTWDLRAGRPGSGIGQIHGRTLRRATAVSPVGGELAIDGPVGSVLLWDPLTGRRLAEHSVRGASAIVALAYDPGGERLAVGDDTRSQVELLDVRSGEVVRSYPYPGHSGARAVAFDPQGRWLATGSGDGAVRRWSLTGEQGPRRGQPARVLRGLAAVRSLAFAPDGSWLAAAGSPGDVLRWDTVSGRLLSTTGHSQDTVTALVVDPAGSWVASADDGGWVRVFGVDGERPRFEVRAHLGPANTLAVDPHGRWLASGGDDGAVRLWDPRTGAELATLVASASGWVVLLPDGRYTVSGRPECVWWAAGLCRFDATDLDELVPYLPGLRRVPEEEPRDLIGG